MAYVMGTYNWRAADAAGPLGGGFWSLHHWTPPTQPGMGNWMLLMPWGPPVVGSLMSWGSLAGAAPTPWGTPMLWVPHQRPPLSNLILQAKQITHRMCAQDHLFHTHGHKVLQIVKCHD
jgi:hypothetical protein